MRVDEARAWAADNFPMLTVPGAHVVAPLQRADPGYRKAYVALCNAATKALGTGCYSVKRVQGGVLFTREDRKP